MLRKMGRSLGVAVVVLALALVCMGNGSGFAATANFKSAMDDLEQSNEYVARGLYYILWGMYTWDNDGDPSNNLTTAYNAWKNAATYAKYASDHAWSGYSASPSTANYYSMIYCYYNYIYRSSAASYLFYTLSTGGNTTYGSATLSYAAEAGNDLAYADFWTGIASVGGNY